MIGQKRGGQCERGRRRPVVDHGLLRDKPLSRARDWERRSDPIEGVGRGKMRSLEGEPGGT
jgi:hypothetical protein